MPVVWFGVLGFVSGRCKTAHQGLTWLEVILVYSYCAAAAAKFFVLTSGRSLELVLFAQCSLLCAQK